MKNEEARIVPVPGEPGRFLVTSATDNLPWLVDLNAAADEPRCACAIAHNRTPERWECWHVREAREFAKSEIQSCSGAVSAPGSVGRVRRSQTAATKLQNCKDAK